MLPMWIASTAYYDDVNNVFAVLIECRPQLGFIPALAVAITHTAAGKL